MCLQITTIESKLTRIKPLCYGMRMAQRETKITEQLPEIFSNSEFWYYIYYSKSMSMNFHVYEFTNNGCPASFTTWGNFNCGPFAMMDFSVVTGGILDNRPVRINGEWTENDKRGHSVFNLRLHFQMDNSSTDHELTLFDDYTMENAIEYISNFVVQLNDGSLDGSKEFPHGASY